MFLMDRAMVDLHYQQEECSVQRVGSSAMLVLEMVSTLVAKAQEISAKDISQQDN